jgi:hypothetical protein
MKCDANRIINVRQEISYISKGIISLNTLLSECNMAKITLSILSLNLLSIPHQLATITASNHTLILTKFNIVCLHHLLYPHFNVS